MNTILSQVKRKGLRKFEWERGVKVILSGPIQETVKQRT